MIAVTSGRSLSRDMTIDRITLRCRQAVQCLHHRSDELRSGFLTVTILLLRWVSWLSLRWLCKERNWRNLSWSCHHCCGFWYAIFQCYVTRNGQIETWTRRTCLVMNDMQSFEQVMLSIGQRDISVISLPTCMGIARAILFSGRWVTENGYGGCTYVLWLNGQGILVILIGISQSAGYFVYIMLWQCLSRWCRICFRDFLVVTCVIMRYEIW